MNRQIVNKKNRYKVILIVNRQIVNKKMSKFDKIAVLNKIGSTGMVPVFYHKDAEVAKKVVKACYSVGESGCQKR